MLEYILFAIGFVLLIKGADYLVEGSSLLAKKLGIPTLAIGLTIVAFGTSAPELSVNIFAALTNASEVSYGNIVGSNICNILLILGIAALIFPLRVERSTVWKEIPYSLLAAVILFILSNKFRANGHRALTWIDGLIMMIFFVLFLFYIYRMIHAQRSKLTREKVKCSNWKIALMIVGGLVALYLGGRWVVDGAVQIASLLGISQYLISATIVAVGTSLPELVTSVVATLKKEFDIAVGNIVGSNIFNILLIMPITSFISPIAIPSFINIDMILLIFITSILFLFMFIGSKHKLDRWQGAIFLVMYTAYVAYLIARG